MTKYKKGDVVLVEVVFSEGVGSKRRPALVISSENYHKSRQEVIIVAITSNIERNLVGDTKIEEWEDAGLLYPSLVTGIIQTVKSSMIIRRLGNLTTRDFQKVQKNLKRSLSF